MLNVCSRAVVEDKTTVFITDNFKNSYCNVVVVGISVVGWCLNMFMFFSPVLIP